jgi:hypothetical protein
MANAEILDAAKKLVPVIMSKSKVMLAIIQFFSLLSTN